MRASLAPAIRFFEILGAAPSTVSLVVGDMDNPAVFKDRMSALQLPDHLQGPAFSILLATASSASRPRPRASGGNQQPRSSRGAFWMTHEMSNRNARQWRNSDQLRTLFWRPPFCKTTFAKAFWPSR